MMTPFTTALVCVLMALSLTLNAHDYYPSGLLRNFKVDDRDAVLGQSETAAVEKFFADHFAHMRASLHWKRTRRVVDNTHVHLRYALYHEDKPVLDCYLNLHFNRKGWIEYGSSRWPFSFELPAQQNGASTRSATRTLIRQRYQKKYRGFRGKVLTTPVVWLDKQTKQAKHAIDVAVAGEKPRLRHRFIVDEQTGQTLEHRDSVRSIDNKVYLIHPDRSSLSTQTLQGLADGASTLQDSQSFFNVRREQDLSSPELVSVDPNIDYTADGGFSTLATSPGTEYNHTCDTNGGDSSCPNQSFDAVNVYYHVQQFRARLQGYFDTLGVSPSLTLDPIDVVVNTIGIDSNLSGTNADEANNAFYTSGIEALDGSIRSGLFFLRPAAAEASICGDTSAREFFDLSRESLVVVHEYQHYITDRVTQMVPGRCSASRPNVGDTLHEGYSDYLAVSHISTLVGEDVTVVGEYGFKNCEPIQRDIAQLKVFTNESNSDPREDFSDCHTGGWSFASGLWELRKTLGAETVDLIAVKSLFFLSTDPGFLESVEVLVRADEALNAGANVAAIRELFYTTLRFAGGTTNLFSDTASGKVEIGFRSCLSVPFRETIPAMNLFLVLLWLGVTLKWGRRTR